MTEASLDVNGMGFRHRFSEHPEFAIVVGREQVTRATLADSGGGRCSDGRNSVNESGF